MTRVALAVHLPSVGVVFGFFLGGWLRDLYERYRR